MEKSCDGGNSFVEYETVILGDFNTNVMHISDNNVLVKALENFIWSCGLKQFVNVLTRVTGTSASILDLTMVSNCDNICQSGVLDIGLSDHILIYGTHQVKKFQINKHNIVFIL